MKELLAAFLFFLPAGIANMSPVFANKIPLLNQWKTPIDFGKNWRGKRLLGPNKTWRGLVFGTLMAALTAGLIGLFANPTARLNIHATFVFAGALMGAGALIGDAVESFFKRRKDLGPGNSWFPFDQTDYIIGGLVFIYPIYRPSIALMLTITLLYFGLHLASSYVGFLLKLKDKPI